MLDLGICIFVSSVSPWAPSLHIIPKASGGWRPFGNYRRLNAVTQADRYAIPHIPDFAARFSGAKILSKVDLVKGYHQIPVAPENIAKTAEVNSFGLSNVSPVRESLLHFSVESSVGKKLNIVHLFVNSHQCICQSSISDIFWNKNLLLSLIISH